MGKVRWPQVRWLQRWFFPISCRAPADAASGSSRRNKKTFVQGLCTGIKSAKFGVDVGPIAVVIDGPTVATRVFAA
jgi:hypothetical protein